MARTMRVMVIGASGKVGSAVCGALAPRHEVIRAGRSSGDLHVDIRDVASLREAFRCAGVLDAVVVAVGDATFAPLAEHHAAPLDESVHCVGIQNKLMGQVNVAYCARDALNENGSITLTTGILTQEPVPGSISSSMVNGALEAFVNAASLEMPRGIRLNAVSPTVLQESIEIYADSFRGFNGVSSRDVGLAYSRCVESLIRGRVIRVGW